MKNIFRRCASLLLAAILILGMLPVTADDSSDTQLELQWDSDDSPQIVAPGDTIIRTLTISGLKQLDRAIDIDFTLKLPQKLSLPASSINVQGSQILYGDTVLVEIPEIDGWTSVVSLPVSGEEQTELAEASDLTFRVTLQKIEDPQESSSESNPDESSSESEVTSSENSTESENTSSESSSESETTSSESSSESEATSSESSFESEATSDENSTSSESTSSESSSESEVTSDESSTSTKSTSSESSSESETTSNESLLGGEADEVQGNAAMFNLFSWLGDMNNHEDNNTGNDAGAGNEDGAGEDGEGDKTEPSGESIVPDAEQDSVSVVVKIIVPSLTEENKGFRQDPLSLIASIGGKSMAYNVMVKAPDPIALKDPLGNPDQYADAFSKIIFWVDNNNEVNIRLSGEELKNQFMSGITFRVEGDDTVYPLTAENMQKLGCGMPNISVVSNGSGSQSYTLSFPGNAFPTVIKKTEEGEEGQVERQTNITWNFPQPECEGYEAVQVNEGNLKNFPSLVGKGESAYGWYYILKYAFRFDLELRTGLSYASSGNLNNPEIQQLILNNFQLDINGMQQRKQSLPFSSLEEDPRYGFQIEIKPDDDEADQYKTATITITNGWKYNIDGTAIEYKVKQSQPESLDDVGRLDAPEVGDAAGAPAGEGEDYLKITYDNTDTIYAEVTDGTCQDGKLILTLTGEAIYDATKIWQDQGVKEADGSAAVRPTSTLELWRYRNGQDYESATPVRNSRDEIVSVIMNGADPDDYRAITCGEDGKTYIIHFEAAKRPYLDSMPKYDSDGYRYVYVVKEYLSGTNANKYRQVFGAIEENEDGEFIITDTLPTWLPTVDETNTPERDENNNCLYNGGTLSNCVDVEIDTKVAKTWKAASFQAELDHVIVELTLQSCPLNPDGSEGVWTDVKDNDNNVVKRVKYGFAEEDLTAWIETATVPKYGLLGRKLKYRWVETAVYQAENAATKAQLKAWYEDSAAKENLLKGDIFTLSQQGRKVKYRSTTTMIDGMQVITNDLANVINYTVEKQWDGVAPQKVTFDLYQVPNGKTLGDVSGTPYLTFKLNETGAEILGTAPDGVSAVLEAGWKAMIKNLPEFDEKGAAYSYVLLENGAADWFPTYEIARDLEGNYNTTVINKPNPGDRILVRKEWVDDSDTTHRDPVTIEVYRKGTGAKLENVEPVTLSKDNDWYQFVTLPAGISVDEVYLQETSVGANKEYTVENVKNGETYTGSYSSAHHNYEVDYLPLKVVSGQNVLTVRNRRVGTVNLTAQKLWKDNDGALRKALKKAFEKMGTAAPTLNLRLEFADRTDNSDYTINESGICVGGTPVPIKDLKGNPVQYVQSLKLDAEMDSEYLYFFGLPKYDRYGAVVHYTVEEVWLNPDGNEADLNEVLAELAESDSELKLLLSEYKHGISSESYIANDPEEGPERPAPVQRDANGNISSDTQKIEITNRLQGTKTVFWHKLWDDQYAYTQGNRPDIYLDIFQVIYGVAQPAAFDDDGMTAYVGDVKYNKLIKDYRWDASNNTDIIDGVLHQGAPINHWHAVLDNMQKYDEETGKEIFYYAVERTKVNIKNYDYADVTFYVRNEPADPQTQSEDENEPDANDLNWPETTKGLTKIGMARQDLADENVKVDGEPDLALKVPEVLRDAKLPGKFYEYPHNMLLEQGYFSNTLSAAAPILGQKLWQALPNGYAKDDLPDIKFNVYRRVNANDELEFVATKTVTDWIDPENTGTNEFEIMYLTDENGEAILDENRKPIALPQYDEKGRRYTYILEEAEIFWGDGKTTKLASKYGGKTPDTLDTKDASAADEERAHIFDTTQPGEKSFVATNAYNGVIGSLSVKKILKVENPEKLPAVKFELKRSYTRYNADGTQEIVEDVNFSQHPQQKIWKYEGKSTAGSYVSGIITFDNLEVYAPNGSKYQYTVTEVKDDFLDGYSTWAAEGNLDKDQVKGKDSTDVVSVSGLEAAPKKEKLQDVAATFLNEYDESAVKYPVELQKIWEDYGNAFGLRPQTITLNLRRHANSQPGQANAIDQQLGTITIDTARDQMSFKPADGSGLSADSITFEVNKNDAIWINEQKIPCWKWKFQEFERYAPNGMIWYYIFSETDVDHYTHTNPVWCWFDEGKKPNVFRQSVKDTLINSLYTEANFEKKWTDTAGNPFTTDYLKQSFTVNFKLQVREKNGSIWTDASTYFTKEKLGETAYNTFIKNYTGGFTKSITDNITGNWKGSFEKLPRAVKDKDGYTIALEYRVVETSVKFGSTTQTVTVDNDGKYTVSQGNNGIVKEAEFTAAGNITTNKLDTVSLTITKRWVKDSYNQYHTRPMKNGKWAVDFVIQRSTDRNTWEDVINKVTVSGTNAENIAFITINGLPKLDKNGDEYTYRARELQPEDGTIVEEGEHYYVAYLASYTDQNGQTIAFNTLESGEENKATNYTALKVWYPEAEPAGENRTVTLALQYLDKNNRPQTLAQVTLNGIADSNLATGETTDGKQLVYGESEPWRAVWQNVPLRHPNSLTGDKAPTAYSVVEINKPSGYLQPKIDPDDNYKEDPTTHGFIVTNIKSTSLEVEKKWLGAGTEKQAVTVGLYRTTKLEERGKPYAENAVKDENGSQLTLTLNAPATPDLAQTGKFENLPAYSDAKTKYYYYALEQKIGETPVTEQSEFAPKYTFEDGKTSITNVPMTTVQGTKIWLDDNNSGGTRPASLTLKLERTTDGGKNWETVTAFVPTWTKGTGDKANEWYYVYSNLPKCSESSLNYVYRVTEDAVSGYVGQLVPNDSNSFINTLTDTSHAFTVTKQWVGSSAGARPEITLTLYRSVNGIDGAGKAEVAATPVVTKNGDIWSYQYSSLDKYDSWGRTYIYWAEEAPVDGYDAVNDKQNKIITNIEQGSLKVTKTVRGDLGEKNREFHFKVTLSGTSDTGIEASSYNKNGFTGGEMEFILKHGEEKIIAGLPAGLTYQVEEIDANKNGYTTTGTNKNGTIGSGEEALVSFVNSRYASQPITTNITGTKTWDDDGDRAGKRPEMIMLTLYRSIEGGEQEIVNVKPYWTKDGNVWSYSYTNLPLWDTGGRNYTYWVRETVPDGYTVRYDGNNITNTFIASKGESSLTVSKTVTGQGADHEAQFHFTVTLDDPTISGVYGQMSFSGGSASFTLKDGESITAAGLPRGIHYKVTEQEANEDGYVTTANGADGWISEKAAFAAFENRKEKPDNPSSTESEDSSSSESDDSSSSKRDESSSSEPDDPVTSGSDDSSSSETDDPDTPKTGDPTNPLLWTLLCIGSLGIMLALVLGGRKRFCGK